VKGSALTLCDTPFNVVGEICGRGCAGWVFVTGNWVRRLGDDELHDFVLVGTGRMGSRLGR
jgi:hypothetical protein